MKKIIKFIFTAIFCTISFFQITAEASPATSYTYNYNAKKQLVRTQDAYLPNLTITELGLETPSDIFIDLNDRLYIADTGNKRILIYDIKTAQIQSIEHEEFVTPTGIYITNEGTIYVADAGAGAVLSFNQSGDLLNKFEKPTSIAYGAGDFKPLKVAVDRAQNIYIVAEGVYNGIIQLSNSGEFLGYFTSNKVSLSVTEVIQDLFFTESQKEGLLGRVPLTFSNVFVDQEGTVYSTTASSVLDALKKHNTAGTNMLEGSTVLFNDLIDVYVDQKGIIYSASQSGSIVVYTTDGDFIYTFGTSNKDADISGLNSSLAAVAVDSGGNVWTLDGEKAFIQSFNPTDYAKNTYAALSAYERGEYDEGVRIWSDVLNQNQMSVLAHNGIAKNYFSKENYELAMNHSQVAGNRYHYSQAFWEVRNKSIQSVIAPLIVIGVVIYAAYIVLKFIHLKKGIFNGIIQLLNRIKSYRFVDDFLFIFTFFKKPLDAFYDLKKGKRGSLIAAIMILFLTFLAYLWNLIGKGFIFQRVAVEDIDFNSINIGFFSILLLFIVCNYLVTSINDGEGSFLQIFKMVCYSLGPILVSLVIGTILSHVLTLDEGFMIDFVIYVGYGWTAINLLLGVQETHNYDTRIAILSILISIGLMLIFFVVLIVIVLMSQQVIQFFQAIAKEGIRNVVG